jgi:hypothetical protein
MCGTCHEERPGEGYGILRDEPGRENVRAQVCERRYTGLGHCSDTHVLRCVLDVFSSDVHFHIFPMAFIMVGCHAIAHNA